jgi:Ca2+-binding EF-hand superfamily protein
MITKNKKVLLDKAKPMLLKQGTYRLINADNLISLLKDVLFGVKLSNTQWKIIVSMADRQKNSMIDMDLFISLVEQSTKQATSHPTFK